ncbi:hypothetical protein B0T16DRAFT_410074 [Cercophora newfieldiana]|uniref:Letm1 RBD domain-containing protein n=1 Tax=Cercophora newfieldiana TaxID=92897 RepID=A0AA39YBV7_9PEZI|nr:hypothetical protein B0T16DRAFT_410074 [Cercophora newfieldiana]
MRHDLVACGALRRQLFLISYARVAPGLLSASRSAQPRLLPITAASLRYSSSSPAKRAAADTPPQQTTSRNRDRTAANPPPSTRPPPLDLPTRSPTTSTFSHLFSTGKAFLTFYKTGLRQIWTNYRTAYPSSSGPPLPPPRPGTRAHLQFTARLRHDISRLPAFSLLLLICGETTPFFVLLFPAIVPLTCRIPKQVTQLQRAAEARRARAIADLSAAWPTDPVPYAARALGLTPSLLDRVGVTLPASLVGGRLQKRLRFLAEDDRLLLQAGGVGALESEEVPLACAERGIPVLDRDEKMLRKALESWLAFAGKWDLDQGAREARMMELILAQSSGQI